MERSGAGAGGRDASHRLPLAQGRGVSPGLWVRTPALQRPQVATTQLWLFLAQGPEAKLSSTTSETMFQTQDATLSLRAGSQQEAMPGTQPGTGRHPGSLQPQSSRLSWPWGTADPGPGVSTWRGDTALPQAAVLEGAAGFCFKQHRQGLAQAPSAAPGLSYTPQQWSEVTEGGRVRPLPPPQARGRVGNSGPGTMTAASVY